MRVRPWGVGLLAFGLSGCVVFIEPPPTETHYTIPSIEQRMTVRTHALSGGDPPTPTSEVPVSDTTTSCPIFKLPPPEPMPVIADLSDPTITTQQEIETILVNHIRALSDHIGTQRRRLVERHQRYLNECRS